MKKIDAFALALFISLMLLLIILTWAIVNIAAWIVLHDHVWIEMRDSGKKMEYFIVLAIYMLSYYKITAVIVVLAAINMLLYFKRLPRVIA